jgi:surfeit locus 1 family protein
VEVLSVIPKLLNRRWWWTTLLVIAGVFVLIRLGYWQLDRLDQRRAYNAHVAERWQQPPFDVTANGLPADLHELEFRRVEAHGTYDYANQILLTSQTRNQAPGAILVTPLKLDDGRAILVARGWIPAGQSTAEYWPAYEEDAQAPVIGLIQESQLLPNGNAPTPPDQPQVEWFTLNIDAIQPQMPYELLPVFILKLPEADRAYNALPLREEPLVLDEGSHFGYAIQWFMFALIFGIGYLFFVHTQELRGQRIAGTLQQTEPAQTEVAPGVAPGVAPEGAPIAQHESHA